MTSGYVFKLFSSIFKPAMEAASIAIQKPGNFSVCDKYVQLKIKINIFTYTHLSETEFSQASSKYDGDEQFLWND